MVNNAEQIYKKIAEKYDFLNHFFSLYIDVLWRKQLLKLISPKKGEIILDLCTGTGDIALEVLRKSEAHPIGLDISREMLDVAREKMRKSGLKFPLVIADALKIPVADSSVDVITIGFGLRNLPDYDRAVEEMARVLKPGGRVYILEFAPPERNIFGFFYWIYLRYIMPILGDIVAGVKEDYRELAVSVRAFLTPVDMKKLLEKKGFKNFRATRLSFGIAYIYSGVLEAKN